MTSYFSKHVGDTVSQIKWIFVVSVCYIARYKIEIIFGEINIKVVASYVVSRLSAVSSLFLYGWEN